VSDWAEAQIDARRGKRIRSQGLTKASLLKEGKYSQMSHRPSKSFPKHERFPVIYWNG
jgi:hypothetical protein